jgi:hypothetical protein
VDALETPDARIDRGWQGPDVADGRHVADREARGLAHGARVRPLCRALEPEPPAERHGIAAPVDGDEPERRPAVDDEHQGLVDRTHLDPERRSRVLGRACGGLELDDAGHRARLCEGGAHARDRAAVEPAHAGIAWPKAGTS